MSTLAHLHVHTTYSFLDGASHVDRMVARAKDHGFPAIACTDHGFMHAWPEFQIAAEKEGIKPILGVEAYIVESLEETYEAQKLPQGSPERKAANSALRSPAHQILLAMTEEGLQNITRLLSTASVENMHYKRPVIDLRRLAQHAAGVIATSSCMSGLIPKAIRAGDSQAVDRLIAWYRQHFGDRFYFEVHDHGIPEEGVIREAIADLSRKYGIPVICANDVHYVEREDYETQKALVRINQFRGKEDAAEYAHERLHLATYSEMARLFGTQFPGSLDETLKLADRCSATLPFGRDYVLPTIAAPPGFVDAFDYVARLCEDALPKRYNRPDLRDQAEQRLRYELSTLRKMQQERHIDFASYFLITSDMTSFARRNGIWVGPGRGSAAGSIVSYLLGITNVDPLRFDLLFERFLNPERVSMPDIDIDFQDSRRDEVFQYLRDKYGEESVMRIVTFTRLGSKSVVRDMARILGLPIAESDRLSEKIPQNPDEKEFSPVFVNDTYVVEKAKADARVAQILDIGPKIFGLSKQTGVHACGVVVTPGPVTDYMPICTVKARGGAGEAERVTQFEGQHIESLGLLKLDVLGLSTGTIISNTLELIQKTRGVLIDMDNIPLDDPATYALFQRGDTDGVFQFESPGMKEWLRQLIPDRLDDLVAMNALYRPGPMELIPDYIRRKHGAERVEYPHPALVDALYETHGIAIYQEQVMQMARVLAGFTLGEADLLRKAIGKKKPKEMAAMQKKFVQGCQDVQHLTPLRAGELFELIKKFVNYGFNKSHASAYALIAYQTAYLKANFPVEYMAVLVQQNASDMEEKTKYLQSCKSMGISVYPPQINDSESGFSASPAKNAIYYGLSAVKGVGEQASSTIIAEREAGGPFVNFRNFVQRVALNLDARITTGDIGALIRVGAFDELGERNALLFEMEHLMDWARRVRDYERGSTNQAQGLDWGSHRKSRPEIPAIAPEDLPAPMSFEEKLRFEMQYLGQFISGHPMEGLEGVDNMVFQITGKWPNREEPEFFQVGQKRCTSLVGYIVGTEEKRIKKGDNAGRAFLVVRILAGGRVRETVAWPETYHRYEFLLSADQRVWLMCSKRGSSLTIEGVVDIRELVADWSQGAVVDLHEATAIDLMEEIGYAPGDKWLMMMKDGEVFAGPNLSLSPERLRRMSQYGSVKVF